MIIPLQKESHMVIYKDLFKRFKNPEESAKEHLREINKFSKDDHHAVLFINSMQGSGKTTSFINRFAKSRDAILLTQSNEKIADLVHIINEKYPDLKYKAIYGLEKACTTYRSDDGIKKKVARYRKLGILTEDIHKIICHDDECDFITQEKAMDGRIIESVARFEAQITLGKAYHNMHWNRLILIDEADGLLNMNETKLSSMPYEDELLESDPYLPEIHRVTAPSGKVEELFEKYNSMINDIDRNEDEIEKTTATIRILRQGFYSVKSGKIPEITSTISELPPIFHIFKSVMDKQMKLIVGSATMRNHSINNETLKRYFRIAYELAMDQAVVDLKDQYTNAESVMDVKYQKSDAHYLYLTNLDPEIMEFVSNYIPGLQTIYAMDGSLIKEKHSYSLASFKKVLNPEDEERRKNGWKLLKKEIVMALKFYELEYGKSANKILLISFKIVCDEINKHIQKLKKNCNLSRDPIFKKITTKPFFSNQMHGINANTDGYDLILTIGDPVDHSTSKLASDMNVFKATKRGFGIKENTDISLKKQIIRTQSSELIEAFHRGRSEIPIIAIGNFLTDENVENQKIIKEIMMNNGFSVINIGNYLNGMKTNNKKEYDVFISSVYKEINFEIK